MPQALYPYIPTIALTSAFAINPVAPEAGNALFLIAAGAALLLMWPHGLAEWRRPIVWMPLAGIVLLALAYLAGSGPAGLEGIAFFLPMLAVWPLLSLLRGRTAEDYLPPLAVLALCGGAGAALMALTEFWATGTPRAGRAVANPIHFADVALLVGFVALFGLAVSRKWWRLLFLLGPLGSLIAVVLSGTRGAVVAIIAMALIALVSSALVKLTSWRMALAGVAALMVVTYLSFSVDFGTQQLSGIERVSSDIAETLEHGAPTDNSTSLRLQMYLGGLRAFLEAPIFGHGVADYTHVADRLADEPFDGAQHLHNDIINMAASAGIFGIAAYLLLAFAPLVEALRAPASPMRPWAIMMALTLVGGFGAMGLTNAMFGVLTITITFAAICVVIGMVCNTRPIDPVVAGPDGQNP